MSTYNTSSSRLTQYDRPVKQPIQQGPRADQPTPARAWVMDCMDRKHADLRRKLGG